MAHEQTHVRQNREYRSKHQDLWCSLIGKCFDVEDAQKVIDDTVDAENNITDDFESNCCEQEREAYEASDECARWTCERYGCEDGEGNSICDAPLPTPP